MAGNGFTAGTVASVGGNWTIGKRKWICATAESLILWQVTVTHFSLALLEDDEWTDMNWNVRSQHQRMGCDRPSRSTSI
jgi:hypothetical protein